MSKLKDALRGRGRAEVKRIAVRAGTTADYLVDQLANGHRRPSVKLARRLVAALPGHLTLADLRPDIYGEKAA